MCVCASDSLSCTFLPSLLLGSMARFPFQACEDFWFSLLLPLNTGPSGDLIRRCWQHRYEPATTHSRMRRLSGFPHVAFPPLQEIIRGRFTVQSCVFSVVSGFFLFYSRGILGCWQVGWPIEREKHASHPLRFFDWTDEACSTADLSFSRSPSCPQKLKDGHRKCCPQMAGTRSPTNETFKTEIWYSHSPETLPQCKQARSNISTPWLEISKYSMALTEVK